MIPGDIYITCPHIQCVNSRPTVWESHTLASRLYPRGVIFKRFISHTKLKSMHVLSKCIGLQLYGQKTDDLSSGILARIFTDPWQGLATLLTNAQEPWGTKIGSCMVRIIISVFQNIWIIVNRRKPNAGKAIEFYITDMILFNEYEMFEPQMIIMHICNVSLSILGHIDKFLSCRSGSLTYIDP